MYSTLFVVLGTVLAVLLLKFFFPHAINKITAGETYRDGEPPQTAPPHAESILEVLPAGVFILDETFNITYANPAFAKELGMNRKELIETPIEDVFVVSEGLTKSLDKISNTSTSPSTHNQAQVTYRNTDGNKTKLELSFTKFDENNRQRFVCMVPSLTDLDASREQLRKTERLKDMGEMVSGLAHEINNPLTGVVGFANLLLESTDEEEPHREELQIIQENAQRCKDIIENMLGFMRSDDPESTELNVNEILGNAIKLTRRNMDIQNIEIQRNLDPELPTIEGNRTQLEEVFVNLLNNAKEELKHYEDEDCIIRAKTQPQGNDTVKITIEDSGSGIPEEMQEEIFEPFFTTKKSEEGTGLGLSIVQGIINELGGTIDVDESVFGGAKFEIAIPTKESPKKLEGQATKRKYSDRLPDSIRNVIAIEDEKSIRQLIDRFREQADLEGKTFENPIDAIEYFNHENPDDQPDVIFLDLVFSGKLRGRDFVEWVEVHREKLLDRIIIMTGNPEDEQVQLTEEHENIILLPKPLGAPDLVRAINRQRSLRGE